MKKVVVHIDRLVLRGVGEEAGPGFAKALSDELRRRLAAPGAAKRLVARHQSTRIQAGSVRRSRRTSPLGVARGAARRIAGKLTS
jgi:hypothetical protein